MAPRLFAFHLYERAIDRDLLSGDRSRPKASDAAEQLADREASRKEADLPGCRQFEACLACHLVPERR